MPMTGSLKCLTEGRGVILYHHGIRHVVIRAGKAGERDDKGEAQLAAGAQGSGAGRDRVSHPHGKV